MSFPRYPKYKDSGVEWLGEVPEHWDVATRSRWLFEIKKRIAGTTASDLDVFSITRHGIQDQGHRRATRAKSRMDYSKYQLVEVGDFAMNPHGLA